MTKAKKDKSKHDEEKDINEMTEKEIEETINEKEIEISEDEQTSADKKIAELETQVSELQDKLLRKAAEFENYKRRTENDQLNLLKYTGESFIVKILPVIDDFERSMQHLDEPQDEQTIKDGIKLIYDKFLKILDDQGVKKIEAVGQPFNVEYHDALMQKEDNSVPPHTVLEEIESGYMYKDRIIRHAKVIVSEASSDEPSEESAENNQNESGNNES